MSVWRRRLPYEHHAIAPEYCRFYGLLHIAQWDGDRLTLHDATQMNTNTGKSHFIGGIVWGISLVLHEDTQVDEQNGRIANTNLADYRVPVNADIGEIDVTAIEIPDPRFNPLGARGIGEIGITCTGAAVANAIVHATGKRVRDLPITPDKLLT
jgi:xanthine dehydrogenase YagR molybdenum-binding subunit